MPTWLSSRMRLLEHIVSYARRTAQSVRRSTFLRSAGVLASTTAIAQGVGLLTLPLLTRIYTPADFSALALFVAGVTLLSVPACLRLDIAIPLPSEDRDAANLLVLALCAATMVSLALLFTIIGCASALAGLSAGRLTFPQLLLVPVAVWLASSYSALQYWQTRKRRFAEVGSTRIGQAVGAAIAQLGLGIAGAGSTGLLWGNLINNGAGALWTARRSLKRDATILKEVDLCQMRHYLSKYRRFPLYSTVEALANTASMHLPIVMIATLATESQAGFLLLAIRALQAPVGLMGGAVSQVFLSRAASELRAGTLRIFTMSVITGLSKVGVGPLIFVGLIASPAFGIVFGSEWKPAGDLVLWMVPWFVLQFLASPISMVMHVTSRQAGMLALTFAGLVIRNGALLVAYTVSPSRMPEYFAISSAAYYALVLTVCARAAGITATDLFSFKARRLLPITAWGMAGVIFRNVLQFAAS